MVVPSLSSPADKSSQRLALRAARAAFPRDAAWPVADAFRRRLTPGLTIAAYVPIGDEADPAPYIAAAVQAGCTIALPHVGARAAGGGKDGDAPRPMRFLARDGVTLVPGPLGLLQPPADAAEVVPDVILTPLLGFDRRGTRLGQGGGFYDRAFSGLPDAWRVGIAWSVQEVDALVADPWDVPLHAIATELDWIEP